MSSGFTGRPAASFAEWVARRRGLFEGFGLGPWVGCWACGAAGLVGLAVVGGLAWRRVPLVWLGYLHSSRV